MLGKKPIDFIMRQFHDAMELLLEYDRDRASFPTPTSSCCWRNWNGNFSIACRLYIAIHKLRERATRIE